MTEPSSEITVLTCVRYDDSLLPQFIDYYRSLGANAFVIGAFPDFYAPLRSFVDESFAEADCTFQVVLCPDEKKVSFLSGGVLEYLRGHYVHEGWVIPADLDEFYQYPETLPHLMSGDYCSGQFVDRIAADGSLAAFNPNISIWQQYPLECDIADKLLQGWSSKVTFCRYNVSLDDGHHHCVDDTKVCLNDETRVHHFKWRNHITGILKQRIEEYKALGFVFFNESERVVNYLEHHGRFILSDFNVQEGWKPEFNLLTTGR